MIGNPEWFEIRKCGWGIKPRTWQGWFYVMMLLVPLIAVALVPELSYQKRLTLSIIWLVLVSVDAMSIMFSIKRDEREYIHEAIAERNAGWLMVAIAIISLLYTKGEAIPPFFLYSMLLGGTLVKSLSYRYLERGINF
jgi:hypothetical protein